MRFNILAWVSLAIVICNLYLLSTSRLTRMIRGVAIQGFLLSILPLLLPNPAESVHVYILVVLSALAKGVLIPGYLSKSIRSVRVVKDTQPIIGYSLSVVFGIVAVALSFYVLNKIPFYSVIISPFHASLAIAMTFIGLFLIITRQNVMVQIIGYLVFENAGFILGISIAAFQPLFIEMGALLDILVGVFIMVMAVKYVRMEHDSLSIRSLERLTN